VRKRGSSKRVQYFGHKEITRKKSNDTGTDRNRKEDQKTPRQGKKGKGKSIGHNGLCAHGL